MAARPKEDVAALSRKLVEEARSGVFKPVYVLMGDEPYYPELVCQAIIDNCIGEYGVCIDDVAKTSTRLSATEQM